MRENSGRVPKSSRPITALFTVLLLLGAFVQKSTPASVTCDERITKIEVLYRVQAGGATAQIFLKNGLTIPWTPRTEAEAEVLGDIVELLSSGKPGAPKVYLVVEEDVVKAFRVVAVAG